ncbi:MAG: hypothetical protein ACREPI_11040 [Candidatus Dormibacterales bacterium]
MGKVTLPEGGGAWVFGGEAQETVVGAGEATLAIDSQMGSVRVSAEP